MTTPGIKRKSPEEGDDDENLNRGVKKPDVVIESETSEDSVARAFLEEVAGLKASFEIALRNLKCKVGRQVERRALLRRNLPTPFRQMIVLPQLRQNQVEIEEQYQKIKDACDHIYRCVKLARASERATAEAIWQSAMSDVIWRSVISEAIGKSEIPDALSQSAADQLEEALSRATVQREISEATADFILEKIHDFMSTTGISIEQALHNEHLKPS